MPSGWWFLLGLFCFAVVVYAIDTHLKKRNRRRPLSQSQPGIDRHPVTPDPDIGLEAVDLDKVNEVNRQNSELERRNRSRTNSQGSVRRPN